MSDHDGARPVTEDERVAQRLKVLLSACEELATRCGAEVVVVATIGECCGSSLPQDRALARRMVQTAARELADDWL